MTNFRNWQILILIIYFFLCRSVFKISFPYCHGKFILLFIVLICNEVKFILLSSPPALTPHRPPIHITSSCSLKTAFKTALPLQKCYVKGYPTQTVLLRRIPSCVSLEVLGAACFFLFQTHLMHGTYLWRNSSTSIKVFYYRNVLLGLLLVQMIVDFIFATKNYYDTGHIHLPISSS